MRDQELEQRAVEFLKSWESFQRQRSTGRLSSFEKEETCRSLIEEGFIADHVNPRTGEYVVQHRYVGVVFFTGSGELVFTEKGLLFARKICNIYRGRASDMHIMKVEYDPMED
ncbi:MAG: hypothetical protein U1A25_03120 [Candidatus Sungbacteria bacterium]|nr:hypothetical protein [bacterium]MDZ4260634.1 hypothetical protein [Candidatus Sungbacteria bacterium]